MLAEQETLRRKFEARRKMVKASTAMDWFAANPEVQQAIPDFFVTPPSSPPVQFSLGFELPQSMKDSIQERLTESFEQPYWEKVNQTTLGDIESILREGLADGKSIRQMAKEIVPNLVEEGKYAEARAKNIARTESGNALNGARADVQDKVIADTGQAAYVKKVWWSVLGNTTRDTHAELSGVPCDKEGLWTLAGIRIRWPGDVRLPPNERCGCQCSTEVQFGLSDAEAEELIAEYELRILKMNEQKSIKSFCPTGPGGGVDPTCSPGGTGDSASGQVPPPQGKKNKAGQFIPGTVGKSAGVNTSDWGIDKTGSQWGMKKIQKMEEWAASGQWDLLHTNFYTTPAEHPDKYKKAVLQAQTNLLKLQPKSSQSPKEETSPKKKPEAAVKPAKTPPQKYSEVPKVAKSKPKVKINPKDFPPAPEFLDTGSAKGNIAVVAQAKALAEKGDLEGLKALKLTASPKVHNYHSALVHELSHQLHPPPAPQKLKQTVAELSKEIPALPTSAIKKVGYWNVTADLGGVPQQAVKGSLYTSQQAQWLHQKGASSYTKLDEPLRKAVKEYTGSKFMQMNLALRNQKSSAGANRAAEGVMKASVPLPEGALLVRRYGNPADAKELYKSLSVGAVVSDRAMLSTSLAPHAWGGRVEMHMTVGAGVRGLPAAKFSKYGSESEVILPPNQRMVITAVKKKPTPKGGSSYHSLIEIHVTILPTLDTQCCPP